MALIDGRLIHKEAYPVNAIDTTGCGDIFHAGLRMASFKGGMPKNPSIWEHGRRPESASRWAAAAASRLFRIYKKDDLTNCHGPLNHRHE